MTNFDELMERWNSDEGRPYRGSLIDMEAYKSAPDNIGCMCAQGQVLHLLAGWEPERLHGTTQREADAESAKLLGISRAHAVLLRLVNDTADGAPAVVLTDPGAVLGDQWSKLLDFWSHLDSMTLKQWTAARTAARTAVGDAAGDAARTAAGRDAGDAAGDAARTAAWIAARTAAWIAAWASNEIQGAEVLREQGSPLFFLSAFGFAGPEDIPVRPDNYGPTA